MIDDALSPNEIRQLMVVKSMLDDSFHQARTATALRRLTAVVLLDGVVERVTHLVAVHRDVKLPNRAGLETITDLVKGSLGSAWSSQQSSADVRQMHRARNAAQHEGVQPAAESLPSWADATRSYVRSLVDAAFNVDIDQVALTDAIRDEELRSTLEKARQRLGNEDDAGCLAACRKAVDSASRSWRNLHARTNRWVPTASVFYSSGARGSELEQRVKLLERASGLDAFSRDRAESAWFTQVTSTRAELLEPGDGERALAFATLWVIAYEEAASTWVPDRLERSLARSRLVGEGDEPAYVDSVVGATSSKLVVRIGHVPPPERYHKWMGATERMARARTGDSRRWAINADGTAQAGIIESDDIKELISALQTALIDAHGALEDERLEREERARLEVRQHEEFDAAGAHEKLPPWVRSLEWEAPERQSAYVRVTLSDLALEAERLQTQSGSSTMRSGMEENERIETAYADGDGILIRPALPREVVRAQLWRVDAEMRASIEAFEAYLASERERSAAVRAEAQAAISSIERM